ncbi:hypothetical protein BDN71DRAFT_1544481 [Pleurotus eryngii]|uniref:Tyr recombinase domain-containing protein n=1 Tax=Pleurotus eryngii TaxID=5323 RepID=A0A9P5ZZE2_PLEER|nr:hypothetical protein BDN71DRAFT_1544481 [Pleurotus eryngii]
MHSLPLDPTPQTLAHYIAYSSLYISSAVKYLSGTWYFLLHLFLGFGTNRSHPLVQAAIRGSMKICASSVNCKLPLRLHHLSTFLKIACSSKLYNDLLFATILSACFFACHHSGELVINNDKKLFNWWKIIKCSSVMSSCGQVAYHLPYHKVDPFYCGSDILFIHFEGINACPVKLLQEYILLRDSIHHAWPALFLQKDGKLPSWRWFIPNLHYYCRHSARAGGATYYASLGLSEDIIQALGHWSSEAWKIYIHENLAICAELQLAQ